MTTLAVLLGPDLTRAQAEEIVAQGKEATIFALLQFAKMLAEQQRPAGPLVGGLDPAQFQQGLQLVKALRTETEALATSTDISRQDVEGLFSTLPQLRQIQLRSCFRTHRGGGRGWTEGKPRNTNAGVSRCSNPGHPISTSVLKRLLSSNFAEGGGGFAHDIQVFSEVIGKFLQVASLPSVDPQVESRLQQLQAIIDSSGATATNIETALTRGATAIENAASRLESVLSRGPVQGFANGGFARGTDTQLAALTPGEVVMNPRASQQWFSDLQRMNAGMQPQFRQQGSPVTNITVGDVNLSGKAETMTPDDIAQALNRRIRIGAVKLER